MKLHQLEYFVAVCECGSFTRAAAVLFVAQPSLSQQIRALEASLGVSLLERGPRGVRPTTPGAALLPEARLLLATAQRARTAVRNAIDGVDRELTVMSIRSVAANVLPRALAAAHQEFPNSPITLLDFNHHRLLELAISAEEGDIAVGPRPVRWDGPVRSLGYEELVLVAHDLSLLDTDEGLSGLDWVLFETSHGLSDIVSRFFATIGVEPRVVARSGQVEAAMMMALSGLGVTMLPENVVPQGLRMQHTSRIGDGVFRQLFAYSRPDPPDRVQQFAELLARVDMGLHGGVERGSGTVVF